MIGGQDQQTRKWTNSASYLDIVPVMNSKPQIPVELIRHSEMPHALIGPSMYLATINQERERIYVTGVDADEQDKQRVMYYENEVWKLLKNIDLQAVAFPAFIVLPDSDSKEVKLFIFGGLELDTATQTFTKKTSVISMVNEIADDNGTAELLDNDDEAIPDYFYDNQVLEVLEGQRPKQRQFIFIGKEKIWEVTIKEKEFDSIKPIADGLSGIGFTQELTLP